jgi:hypothetical protein
MEPDDAALLASSGSAFPEEESVEEVIKSFSGWRGHRKNYLRTATVPRHDLRLLQPRNTFTREKHS